MKMFTTLVLSFGVLLTLGCASVQNSQDATFKDSNGKTVSSADYAIGGLKITYDVDETLSDKNFQVVQVTIENTTDHWVKLKQTNLDFGNEALNKAVKITAGSELVAWSEAVQQRQAIRDNNTSAFLASVAILGTVAVTGSKSSSGRNAGAVAALGAVTVDGIRGIRAQIKSLEQAGLFPSTHLLAGEIDVPPGLFQKKWVVLNTTSQLKDVKMSALTGDDQTVDVKFKLQ